jgi:hypothetical protein
MPAAETLDVTETVIAIGGAHGGITQSAALSQATRLSARTLFRIAPYIQDSRRQISAIRYESR